jgi:hypothetical protein
VYSAAITVTDNNGQVAATSVSFDTFSVSNYTWEAEDYDYNGGFYYDNPQVDYYLGAVGLADVDFHKAGTGGSPIYRSDAVGTEVTGDVLRPQYNTTYPLDYDVGFTAAGDWWNYTRTYPAGKYNVYLRAARGNTGTSTMGLKEVTSGWGTTTQTTSDLGTFTIPATGNWQVYAWVPLKDNSGAMATVSLNGTNTLRLTDGGANLNFLMLVPAVALDTAVVGSGNNPHSINMSFGTQVGFTYSVVYKNNLSDSTWTTLSTFPGDGTVKTVNDPMTAPGRFYRLLVH